MSKKLTNNILLLTVVLVVLGMGRIISVMMQERTIAEHQIAGFGA